MIFDEIGGDSVSVQLHLAEAGNVEGARRADWYGIGRMGLPLQSRAESEPCVAAADGRALFPGGGRVDAC